jgi:hypothetical protein
MAEQPQSHPETPSSEPFWAFRTTTTTTRTARTLVPVTTRHSQRYQIRWSLYVALSLVAVVSWPATRELAVVKSIITPARVRLTPCLQTGVVFPSLWRPSTIVVAVLGSRMLLVLLNRAVSPRPSVSWHLQPTVLARWLLRLANLVLSRRPPTHTRMFARRASTRSVVRRWAWRDTRARLGLAFLVFYS